MIVASDTLTSSRAVVRRALDAREDETLAALCRRAVARGADWIDLNPGHVKPASRAEVWSFLIAAAESACELPLMIDAPDVASMALALRACSRPPILNMATAADDRLGPVLDLAAAHDLDVVAGLFVGLLPRSVEERMEHAALVVGEAAGRGIDASRVILDPIVAPLASPDGERQAAAVLDLLRSIPLAFDEPPRRMIGLSNLTTGTTGRRSKGVAAPFLHAAFGAGLEVVLLDTDDEAVAEALQLCRVFDGARVFAAEERPRR